MSLVKVINMLGVVKPLLKGFRLWIMSDGKFSKDRAIILALFLIIIFSGIYFIGLDSVMEAVDLLDDVSDAIGVNE